MRVYALSAGGVSRITVRKTNSGIQLLRFDISNVLGLVLVCTGILEIRGRVWWRVNLALTINTGLIFSNNTILRHIELDTILIGIVA